MRLFDSLRTRFVVFSLLLAPLGYASAATPTVGLVRNDPRAGAGYVLISPLNYKKTYLIDNQGHQVHSWTSQYNAGLMAYLLPDGDLLRGAVIPPSPRYAAARGFGGRVERFNWDGTLVWSYDFSNNNVIQHHDITPLPNGNVIFMAWEAKSGTDAIQSGRNPSSMLNNELWSEFLVEVKPTGATTGDIVWEWHAWDHMVQDFDSTKSNYAAVGNHPELIDINFDTAFGDPDWIHFNGIAYNPALDQLVISSRQYSEFWILDHSTTTAQAASHGGGTRGKGGDLLYRWGNPRTYRRGGIPEQALEFQHDAHWIAPGLPGAGNFLLFNNGGAATSYSRIDEVTPMADSNGEYPVPSSGPYLPVAPTWRYTASPPTSFFAAIISGADRMLNGNTLVAHGPTGTFFEVTSSGEEVWRYINPVGPAGPFNQGDVPPQQGPLAANAVFKIRRYAPDYPAFAGRTLSPGAPIEQFTNPRVVPDGRNGTAPLIAMRLDSAGSQIELHWDAVSCPSGNYNLLYGQLAGVSNYTLNGAACALGTTGAYAWQSVPNDNLFFLVVGTDPTGIYESSWGTSSSGQERGGTLPSQRCSVTTKQLAGTCP